MPVTSEISSNRFHLLDSLRGSEEASPSFSHFTSPTLILGRFPFVATSQQMDKCPITWKECPKQIVAAQTSIYAFRIVNKSYGSRETRLYTRIDTLEPTHENIPRNRPNSDRVEKLNMVQPTLKLDQLVCLLHLSLQTPPVGHLYLYHCISPLVVSWTGAHL